MRNEKADEFLALLKEWAVLCKKYVHEDVSLDSTGSEDQEDESSPLDKDEFVVEKLIGICYGGSGRENGLYFKVLMCYFFNYAVWIPQEKKKGSVWMPALFENFQDKKFNH